MQAFWDVIAAQIPEWFTNVASVLVALISLHLVFTAYKFAKRALSSERYHNDYDRGDRFSYEDSEPYRPDIRICGVFTPAEWNQYSKDYADKRDELQGDPYFGEKLHRFCSSYSARMELRRRFESYQEGR